MIQRIQSLYLLGIIICAVLLFFTALATVTTFGHNYDFNIWGIEDHTAAVPVKIASYLLLTIANSLIALLALIVIFRFKNRKQQLLLARLNLLFIVILVAGMFFYFEKSLTQIGELDKLNSANASDVNYSITALLPLVAMVLNILAIRAINQDEELVRSADRIR